MAHTLSHAVLMRHPPCAACALLQILDLAARQQQAEAAFLEICSDETGDVEAGLLRSKLLNLIKPDGGGKADARLRICLDNRLGGSKAKQRVDFDGFVEVCQRALALSGAHRIPTLPIARASSYVSPPTATPLFRRRTTR